MHGIKIKDVFIFGICVIVAYSFFGDSPSEDSPDVTLNTNESISSPLITPSSQNTPSTSLIPTHTSSTLDLVTPTPSFKEIPRIKETSNNDTLLTTSYTWRYGMSDWTWELSINQATYDYYKNLPRAPSKNYSIYVTNPSDDEYIDRLANKIHQAAQEKGYSDFDTVSLAATFVQSLEYTSDIDTEGYDEYPRYPIETLIDNGGDCEDTAILTASIIDAMGYGVVLLELPNVLGNTGHMAIGVKGSANIPGTYWNYLGEKYYYLETTGNGWSIGELPDEYKYCTALIYPMTPVAILSSSWESDVSGSYLELKVKVENLGSAIAENIYVETGFDAGNNKWWNSKRSDYFTIEVNGSGIVTLYLTPPFNEHTRLLIKIVYQGYSVEESHSDWFDT